MSNKTLKQCKLFLYYEDDVTSVDQQKVKDAISYWVESMGGSLPVSCHSKKGSWEETLTFYILDVIANNMASLALGYAVVKAVGAINFLKNPKDESQKNSAEPIAGQLITKEEEYKNLEKLGDVFPKDLPPTRYTLVVLGDQGEKAMMVTCQKNSDSAILSFGSNDEVIKLAQKITFQDK